MLILLWEEIAPFGCLLFKYVNIHAYQCLSILCFKYHLYAEMVLGLYVNYGTYNGAIHVLLFLLTLEYESEFTYKDTSITITLPPLNVHELFWEMMFLFFPSTFFKGVF